jgi:hypothetical protein
MNSVLQSNLQANRPTDFQPRYRRQVWFSAKDAVEWYAEIELSYVEADSIDFTRIAKCAVSTGTALPLKDHLMVFDIDDMRDVRLALVRARRDSTRRDWKVWCEARVGSKPLRIHGVSGVDHESLSGPERSAIPSDLTDEEAKKLARIMEQARVMRAVAASGLGEDKVWGILERVDRRVDSQLDRLGRLVSGRGHSSERAA